MVWTILAAVFVICLAAAIRKAVKGTPFRNCCGCTPNIDHLRWVEKGQEPKKREERW